MKLHLFLIFFLFLVFFSKVKSYNEYIPQDIKRPRNTYFISNPNSILSTSEFESINQLLQKI